LLEHLITADQADDAGVSAEHPPDGDDPAKPRSQE
jgi:hypothetical protein